MISLGPIVHSGLNCAWDLFGTTSRIVCYVLSFFSCEMHKDCAEAFEPWNLVCFGALDPSIFVRGVPDLRSARLADHGAFPNYKTDSRTFRSLEQPPYFSFQLIG